MVFRSTTSKLSPLNNDASLNSLKWFLSYRFSHNAVINIAKHFEETGNILWNQPILQITRLAQITISNRSGLLIVTVEQLALAVKCDLLPGKIQELTVEYEDDRAYSFTFRCHDFVSIQK